MSNKITGKQFNDKSISQKNINIDESSIISKNSTTSKEYVDKKIRNVLNLYNSKLNLNMIANVASYNQLACDYPITEFPIGSVIVKVNGVKVKVGEGYDCYFSPDGSLVRYGGNAKKGDYLFWSSINYDIDTEDEIDFSYIVGYDYITANENDVVELNSIYNSIVVKYVGNENTTMVLNINDTEILVGNEGGYFIWDKGGENEYIFNDINEHIITDVSGVTYTVWFDGFESIIFSIKKGIVILDEVKYGYLYNYEVIENESMLISSNGLLDDWRVSTNDDWDNLSSSLTTYPNIDIDNVARYLKSKRIEPLPEPRWDYYSELYLPVGTFNFNALPGKIRLSDGTFNNDSTGNWWTTNDIGGGRSESRRMRYDSNKLNYSSNNKNSGLSLRLVRPLKTNEYFLPDGSGYPDIPLYKGNDGKLYDVIKMGNLIWLSNNLAETEWNNNTDIYIETGSTIWTKGGIEDINDWYLPSIVELERIYTNLNNNEYANFSYCSSSENSSTEYIALNFDGGTRDIFNKNYTTFFIIIRDFVTGNTYNIGDLGPTNGWIFEKVDMGSGNYKYYESSNMLLSSSDEWSNIVDSLANTSQLFGEGKNNTSLIINQSGHIDSLANICNNYIYTIPYPMMCAFDNNENLV